MYSWICGIFAIGTVGEESREKFEPESLPGIAYLDRDVVKFVVAFPHKRQHCAQRCPGQLCSGEGFCWGAVHFFYIDVCPVLQEPAEVGWVDFQLGALCHCRYLLDVRHNCWKVWTIVDLHFSSHHMADKIMGSLFACWEHFWANLHCISPAQGSCRRGTWARWTCRSIRWSPGTACSPMPPGTRGKTSESEGAFEDDLRSKNKRRKGGVHAVETHYFPTVPPRWVNIGLEFWMLSQLASLLPTLITLFWQLKFPAARSIEKEY